MEEVAGAESSDFLDAQAALSQMIREGVKSFSGYERNCCFLNMGGGEFATVSAVSGLDFLDDARAVAAVDWDHDGDLDLLQNSRTAPQVRVLRNDSTSKNHFVALKLTGTSCNRDAIGARVELYRQGVENPLIKTVRAGSGFLSQSSKWLHFGLGSSTKIDRIVVRWPQDEGRAETFTGLVCDSRYLVVQGQNSIETWTPPQRTVRLVPSVPELPKPSDQAKIICSASVQVPELPYSSFAGEQSFVAARQGRAVLVNLWATWCAPCVEELSEITQRADELKAAGVEVLAISVDGIVNDASTSEQARDFLKEMGFPFPAGTASRELLDKLQILRGELFNKGRPFPLPSSFLIDRQGRLAIVNRGTIDVDTLLSDLVILDASELERRDAGVPIAGRWFTQPQQIKMAQLAHAFRTAGYEKDALFYDQKKIIQQASQIHNAGLDLLNQGRFPEAITCFQQALEKDPKCAPAFQNMGIALLQLHKFAASERCLREAIRLDKGQKEAHLYLGNALSLTTRLPEALSSYQEAVRLDSEFAMAHAAIGWLYGGQLGDPEKAEPHLTRAVELQPDQASWLFDLGVILSRQNKFAKASERFRQASLLTPDDPKIQLSLAEALAASGKHSDALEPYRAVLRIDPQHKQAALQLAWYLSTLPDDSLRDAEEAVKLAERVSAKSGDRQPQSLDILAAAYAEAGRYDDAVKTATMAVEIASSQGESALSDQIQGRLTLYSQKQPYRLLP